MIAYHFSNVHTNVMKKAEMAVLNWGPVIYQHHARHFEYQVNDILLSSLYLKVLL